MKKIKSLLGDRRFIIAVYAAVALMAGVISYNRGPKNFNGQVAAPYNNFLIFKHSHFHLLEGKNLYASHPTEHWDLYKYSPTFAFLMAPFAHLPDLPGLLLWNLLNALALCWAIRGLPVKNEPAKALILWFVLAELLTSIQNTQSNGLMAALMIGGYNLLEQRKVAGATLLLALSVFVKPFGAVALLLFLLYPHKIKFAAYSLLWTTALFLLPLATISASQFNFQYQNWLALLKGDYPSAGLSVMGWLKSWFGLEVANVIVLAAGAALLLTPLLRFRWHRSLNFRFLFMASILIWVVIFNHKAESPTFVIALAGVGIWFFTQARTTLNLVLLTAAFILTSLSPTFVFPASVRENWINPLVLKALPCILIFMKIFFELAFRDFGDLSSQFEPACKERAIPLPERMLS